MSVGILCRPLLIPSNMSSVRNRLTTLHLLLATLLLPAALLFLITGGLYTWGIKGDQATTTHDLVLAAPLNADLDAQLAVVRAELVRLGLSEPSGDPSLRKQPGKLLVDWTGSEIDVQLESAEGASAAKLTVKEASAYRRFVQLHKAKGGVFFKVYATIFAVSLLLLLITGCWMAWQMPKFRGLALASSGAGVLLFAVAAICS